LEIEKRVETPPIKFEAIGHTLNCQRLTERGIHWQQSFPCPVCLDMTRIHFPGLGSRPSGNELTVIMVDGAVPNPKFTELQKTKNSYQTTLEHRRFGTPPGRSSPMFPIELTTGQTKFRPMI
jgi:hypothetical protein